jgi:hypothetical protein
MKFLNKYFAIIYYVVVVSCMVVIGWSMYEEYLLHCDLIAECNPK